MSARGVSVRRLLLLLAVVAALAGAAGGIFLAWTSHDARAKVLGLVSIVLCVWLVLVVWDMLHGSEDDLFEQHYGTGGRTRLSRRKRPDSLQMKYYSWNEPGKKGYKEKD